jgi:hypothetical protein
MFDPLDAYRKDGQRYWPYRRQAKRDERKGRVWTPVEDAYYLGCSDVLAGRPYRNIFPAGKRHNAYHRGYMPWNSETTQ